MSGMRFWKWCDWRRQRPLVWAKRPPSHALGDLNDDPGFEDAEKQDLRLKPSSIVFEKIPSFQNIPVEKIGLLKERPVGAPGS